MAEHKPVFNFKRCIFRECQCEDCKGQRARRVYPLDNQEMNYWYSWDTWEPVEATVKVVGGVQTKHNAEIKRCTSVPELGKRYCHEHQAHELPPEHFMHEEPSTFKDLSDYGRHVILWHPPESDEGRENSWRENIFLHLQAYVDLLGLPIPPEGIRTQGPDATYEWIQEQSEAGQAKIKRLKAELKKEREKRKAVTPLPEQLALPYETYLFIRDALLPERIPQEQLEKVLPKQLEFPFMEGKELFKYTNKTSTQSTTCYIPKEILHGNPPSRPLMRKAYFSSLAMAVEQRSNKVRFTLGEKLRKLGYDSARLKVGGEIFGKMDTAEKALGGMIFHYKNHKRGKKYIEMIGTVYTNVLQAGQGKGAVYEADLNPVFTQHINFETGKIDGRFIPVRSRNIIDSSMGHYERNIRLWAQDYFNMPELTVYGSTLLEATGAPESLLKRKKRRDQLYIKVLQWLQQEGYKRTGYELDRNAPGDCRKYKLTFIPPKRKTGAGMIEYKAQLNETEEAFIIRFLEWESSPVHYGNKGMKKTSDKAREQITNTVKKYGLEKCLAIYTNVQDSSFTHPRPFWNKIKELKKLKA